MIITSLPGSVENEESLNYIWKALNVCKLGMQMESHMVQMGTLKRKGKAQGRSQRQSTEVIPSIKMQTLL